MPESPPVRIHALDLIRGVAVLGILAVNITSFAAPTGAGYSPNLPAPGTTADNWAFGVTLVFFEGKMRALFSILFGASLLLFVERQNQVGREGAELQIRRLLWLALLGWLHFLLLWDGDDLAEEEVASMQQLADQKAAEFHAGFLGRTVDVLFETAHEGVWDGLTGNYIRVYTDAPVTGGSISRVCLERLYRDGIWGRLA